MKSGSETIVAPASGSGRSAIAVFRISGDAAEEVVQAVLADAPLPVPRRAAVRTLRDPETKAPIDQALVLWMPGPSSFTGEDVVELHTHGGSAVRTAVLRALLATRSCRLAEPGEFTRRAFLHGRLDLTAAEGLADLIDAETEAQRRQAFRQLEGALSVRVERWRDRLLEASALLVAGLDFSDEGDVADDLDAPAMALMASVEGEIAGLLRSDGRGERLRDGFAVAIAGPPNAGKSTLLNAIAKRDVAIVSPQPGTTRDPIEVRCDLDGLPVLLVDTAGLRDTADVVEQAGISRALDRMRTADLVLWLRPPDGEGPPPSTSTTLVVDTKADLAEGSGTALAVSAVTGAGMDALLGAIREAAEGALGSGDSVITRERHRAALTDAARHLARAREAGAPELVADDLRSALRSLEALLGRVDVEDVLGRVFSSFCIGK